MSKIFVGEPLSALLISGIEKFHAYEAFSRFSIENMLPHSTEKLRRGILLCFTKFLVSKKLMERRGGEEGGSITFFVHNFFLSQCQKFS